MKYINHPRFSKWPRQIQEAANKGKDQVVKNYLSNAAKKGHRTRKLNPKPKGPSLSPEESQALKAMQEKYGQIKRRRSNMPQVDLEKFKQGYDPVAVSLALRDVKPSQIDYHKKKLKKLTKKLRQEAEGEMKPLIVSKDNYLLDGHHRHRAAKKVWGPQTKVKAFKMKEERKQALDKLERYQ